MLHSTIALYHKSINLIIPLIFFIIHLLKKINATHLHRSTIKFYFFSDMYYP